MIETNHGIINLLDVAVETTAPPEPNRQQPAPLSALQAPGGVHSSPHTGSTPAGMTSSDSRAEWYLPGPGGLPHETVLSLQEIQRVCVVRHEPRGESTRTWILVSEVVKLVLRDDPDREHTVQFGLKQRQWNRHLSVR